MFLVFGYLPTLFSADKLSVDIRLRPTRLSLFFNLLMPIIRFGTGISFAQNVAGPGRVVLVFSTIRRPLISLDLYRFRIEERVDINGPPPLMFLPHSLIIYLSIYLSQSRFFHISLSLSLLTHTTLISPLLSLHACLPACLSRCACVLSSNHPLHYGYG